MAIKDSHTTSKSTQSGLNLFEKMQVRLGVAQILILTFTLIAAVYIGFQQNSINQKLYDLNFNVSLEVTYDNKQLNIINKGKENVWIWGTKLADNPKNIERDSRLIPPGGFYYMLATRLELDLIKNIGINGEIRLPLEVYIESANQRRYVVKLLLWAIIKDGVLAVHTQTLAIQPFNWEKQK